MERFERPALKPKRSPCGILGYLLRRPTPVSTSSQASGVYRVRALELLCFRAILSSVSELATAGAFMNHSTVVMMTSKGSLPVYADVQPLGIDEVSL